jgi:hypothetical protein
MGLPLQLEHAEGAGRMNMETSQLVVPDDFRVFVSRIPGELKKKLSIHELRELLAAATPPPALPWKRFAEDAAQEKTPLFVRKYGCVHRGIYREPHAGNPNGVWSCEDGKYYEPEDDDWYLYESHLLATVPK